MYCKHLEYFKGLSAENQMKEMENISVKGMISLADYMYDHYDEFKLILCCSKDTRYCDLAEQMALLDEEATREFAKTADMVGASVSPVPSRLEHILTTGLFTMFFELIIYDVPREEADEYISKLTKFYLGGYRGIMGVLNPVSFEAGLGDTNFLWADLTERRALLDIFFNTI